ncbi:hypothetical protein [Maribellus sediminis]|uniref:hypothetical protein n=1 Tax=Maribellus sediminis TaxID=2696285 RepID=UPI001431549E|nr:hypothetical protein [Maribellus sediminis]
MKNYSVFISSSDAYSDIWPLFFDLFQMNWHDFNGVIYLNTEEKEYSHPGLNIVCTRVGKLGSFGKTFRAGLDKVPTDHVLLIMIDYIFMDKVRPYKLEEYYNYFVSENLDTLCLVHQNYPNQIPSVHPELNNVIPPAPYVMFSYQVAFWKKIILREMALPHENPWMSEWYGSKRAEKMKIRLACLKQDLERPIQYDLKGCLHQGKWLDNAVDFIRAKELKVNFDKRGCYVDGYNSLIFRVKLKLTIWSTGLRGSYWDLWKR